VKFTYTSSIKRIERGRQNMLLDISKLKTLGWKPKLNSRQAIRTTVRTFIQKYLKNKNEIFNLISFLPPPAFKRINKNF